MSGYDDTILPECPGCGSTDYDGELFECPYCGIEKCSCCDMGNNVGCLACGDNDYEEVDE